MEKPTKIINKSQLQNGLGLKGPIGSLAASLLMSILEINKLNRDYEKVCQYEGPEFSKKVLELYGITVVVPEEDLKNLPEGQIVTISNHAFGGADGLIISSIVGALKPDYKILTNFILSLIPALKSSFMPVNPFKGGDVNKSSFAGIKVALQHIKDGGSLGLFPAGAVSTWQKKKDRTAIRKGCRPIPEDCPWSPNMAKLIMTANAPVVPIYFDGGNSFSMHVLGRIYHFLRTGRLIHELRNKRGKTLRLRIGKPIMPEEMAKFPDGKSLINYQGLLPGGHPEAERGAEMPPHGAQGKAARPERPQGEGRSRNRHPRREEAIREPEVYLLCGRFGRHPGMHAGDRKASRGDFPRDRRRYGKGIGHR